MKIIWNEYVKPKPTDALPVLLDQIQKLCHMIELKQILILWLICLEANGLIIQE